MSLARFTEESGAGRPAPAADQAELCLDVDAPLPAAGGVVVVSDVGHARARRDHGDDLADALVARLVHQVREAAPRESRVVLHRAGGAPAVVVFLESRADAEAVAALLPRTLAGPVHHGGRRHPRSPIVGWVDIGQHRDGRAVGWAVERATDAVAWAAQTNRTMVQWTPEVTVALERRRVIVADLPDAIVRGELRVEYQPIIDLEDGSIPKVEALVRWTHRGLGEVSPAEFVPLAEELDLIGELDGWVLRQSIEQARQWQGLGREIQVSVNVSVRDLERGLITELVDVGLESSGLPARLLGIEITERIDAGDFGECHRQLERIRALGVDVALDDFGTGQSSLAKLRNLPITVLKVDRQFISDVAVDADAAGFVWSMVAMAKSLGLDVVAEGIETASQLGVLSQLGVRYGQGWLFGPGVAPDVITSLDLADVVAEHGGQPTLAPGAAVEHLHQAHEELRAAQAEIARLKRRLEQGAPAPERS